MCTLRKANLFLNLCFFFKYRKPNPLYYTSTICHPQEEEKKNKTCNLSCFWLLWIVQNRKDNIVNPSKYIFKKNFLSYFFFLFLFIWLCFFYFRGVGQINLKEYIVFKIRLQQIYRFEIKHWVDFSIIFPNFLFSFTIAHIWFLFKNNKKKI